MRADGWTENEIILAIAACPRDKQSYSPRHPEVIELADLLGRTPGAVSHHFANISHLIHGGDHGETHVGKLTRVVFERFQGKEDELHRRAAEIRGSLMVRDSTPRVERESPQERSEQLTLEVFEGAASHGLPEDSIRVYEREGSFHWGAILEVGRVILKYPVQAAEFLRWLSKKLGDGLEKSLGFELASRGKWEELAVGLLAQNAPGLHLDEFDGRDRITLALGPLVSGRFKNWKPLRRHFDLLRGMNRAAERGRVASYLNIRANHLCDNCLLMLRDLVDWSIRHSD